MINKIIEKLKNIRISNIKKYYIKDYIFIVGIYNYLNSNNKLNYHIRIYTKDYKNITSILKDTGVFKKTYQSHGVTDDLKSINDIDYLNHITYILNNIVIDI